VADEDVAAGPWSARTNFYPHWQIETEGPFAWKGRPGADFAESVNNAKEWFAARRKNYYVLTYHGRLSPKWESNAHSGQTGYGGGMICQLQVPGKGLVLASTLNGSYGEGMDPSLWRAFHLHTLAGIQADGAPFVTGDSEHVDARLENNQATGSGAVRDTPLRCRRSFTFADKEVACSVQLDETSDSDLLGLWLKHNLRGKVRETYEMIPYLPNQRPKPGAKKAEPIVAVIDGTGKVLKPLGQEPVEAAGILIDQGGFGVRIFLDKPRTVLRGAAPVVLIRLADRVVPAKEVALSYRLAPFGNDGGSRPRRTLWLVLSQKPVEQARDRAHARCFGVADECRKLKRCRGWSWALGKAEKARCRRPCRRCQQPVIDSGPSLDPWRGSGWAALPGGGPPTPLARRGAALQARPDRFSQRGAPNPAHGAIR